MPKPFKGGGGGGSEINFNFFVVSYRGEWELRATFFGTKKYCSYAKLSHLENSMIHTITLHARTLIAKINFKIYLLLQFLRYRLDTWELCSRARKKLMIEPIFDLGIRSENIEF